MLVPLLVSVALWAAAAWAVLAVGGLLGGPKAVWALGLAGLGFLGWSILNTVVTCGAEPIYTAPTCDDASLCGNGTMAFACDGPGGAISYGYALLGAPLIMAVTLLLCLHVTIREHARSATS